MKKLLITFGMALLGSIVICHAQKPEITVFGKLDGQLFNAGESWEASWGDSSLYTFVDGEFANHFSYNFGAIWAADGIGDLYRNLGKNEYSALLGASMSYFNDWFSIKLGKLDLPMGSIEYQDYDALKHSNLCSYTWNELLPYLWGGVLELTPWDNTSFDFGITSSPLAQSIFEKLGYSFKWSGEYGIVSTAWSLNYFNSPYENNDVALGALGTALNFDHSTLSADIFLAKDYQEYYLDYSQILGEKFEIFGRAGLASFDKLGFRGGLGAHYYPLGNELIRIHADFSYDDILKLPTFSIGALINLAL